MKHLSLVTILLAAAGNALADEPYKHQYENGGHFEVQEAALAAIPADAPFKRADENGSDLDLEALPPTAAGAPHSARHQTAPR